MNKTEAAQYLGIGLRSLERYTADGKVASRKVKGKTGPLLDYEEEELERFRTELGIPQVVGKIVREINSESPPPSSALAVFTPQSSQLVPAKQTVSKPEKSPIEPVQAAAKLLLTLAEAQTLTGLSPARLRSAAVSGELKGAKIGRAWRVRRADLEEYLRQLF